jgi:uncharacterized membrane protein YbhN (UPF0104 family)
MMDLAKKQLTFRSAQLVFMGLFVIGLVWFLPRLDWVELWVSFQSASKLSILWALLAVVAYWLTRSLILWTVLRAKHVVSFWNCWLAMILGMTTDQMIPGRVGYFVRFGVLLSRCKMSKTLIVVALLVCLVVEAAGLVGLLLTAVVWDSSTWQAYGFSWPALLSLTLVMAGFIVFLGLLPRLGMRLPARFRASFTSLNGFVESSRQLRHWSSWMGSSLMMWIAQLAVVLFSAQSFQVDLSFTQAVLLLVAINLATLVPVVPGNLGSMQVVCTTVLMSFGLGATQAFAISIVYHFVHLAPLLAVGALSSLRMGAGIRSLSRYGLEQEQAA